MTRDENSDWGEIITCTFLIILFFGIMIICAAFSEDEEKQTQMILRSIRKGAWKPTGGIHIRESIARMTEKEISEVVQAATEQFMLRKAKASASKDVDLEKGGDVDMGLNGAEKEEDPLLL